MWFPARHKYFLPSPVAELGYDSDPSHVVASGGPLPEDCLASTAWRRSIRRPRGAEGVILTDIAGGVAMSRVTKV